MGVSRHFPKKNYKKRLSLARIKIMSYSGLNRAKGCDLALLSRRTSCFTGLRQAEIATLGTR